MAQPSPLFSLEGVSYSHEGKALFSGVDLALYPGERVGVTGRNGAGKSTLLHIGAGLRTPGAGLVRHRGEVCRTERDFAAARRSFGYLLQHAEDQLFCSTVLEDVAFGPYNLGHSSEEAEAMARRTLEDVGIAHLADRNGQRLSGGEQKLAAMATILVMGVDLLFLDEPTNDLDEEARSLLTKLLKRYSLPALIVSHDLAFVRSICTRFCLLEGGRLIDLPGAPDSG